MSDLIEQLREQERAMSREQMDRAVAIVLANGWPVGSMPPPYVWAEAYRLATLPAGGAGDATQEEHR